MLTQLLHPVVLLFYKKLRWEYPNRSRMKIALVADRSTASCFKLAGLSDVNVVDSPEDAGKKVEELLERPDLGIILITERLVDQVPGLADKTVDRKYPLILPIPEKHGTAVTRTDLIVELIRRKAGIEVKL